MIKRYLLSVLITGLLFIGCGGGSSGTGTRSYEGVVLTTNGAPFSGATITLQESGDSTTTDSQGKFALESSFEGEQATFLVEKGAFESSNTITNLNDPSSQFMIEIVVDEAAGTAIINGTDIRVKIVGECDSYFENRRRIRQANEVPQGKLCTIEVTTRATRGALPFRAYRLEYQSCESSSAWHTVGGGETNDVGTSNFNFSFVNDERHCLYRVLVPINDNSLAPLSFEIRTLTYQNQ